MTVDNTPSMHEQEELKKTVTKLKCENKRLERLAQQADAANRAKSDFLAMISHEIRTPMNGVIGLTELLLDTELGTKQKNYTELILSSARNLLTLINSLLDFSKIEADMMELDIAEFNLRKLADELMTLYSVATERKEIEIFAEIDPGVSEIYLGDSYRIRQILVNLLGNAIKFTEKGSIVLKILCEKTNDDGKDELRFEIRDSGPGIPSDKLDRLFKPFSQVDTSSTRRYGGTGLGLSICQKLVELMGGEIGVESKIEQGSTFWFRLPLVPVYNQKHEQYDISEQETIAVPEIHPEDLPDRKDIPQDAPLVMIVDDDETNRFVLETVLLKAGARVVSAKNGKEALELLESNETDLILMDCQMPVMDGFEASKFIHAQARKLSRKRPTIVALTADATQTTKQQCKEVGMDDYLTKPLEFGKMQRVIDNWLPGSGLLIISQRHEPGINEVAEFVNEDNYQGVQIDPQHLVRLKMNMGNIAPVIRVFLDSLPVRLKELKQAVDNLDHEEIRRIAHQLKGSSSQFGAIYMASLCLEAENMGKNRQLEKIGSVWEKLVLATDQVVEFLSEELDK